MGVAGLTRLLLLAFFGRLGCRAIRVFGEKGVGCGLGALGIALFLLAGGDVSQCVGGLRVLRPFGGHDALCIDRLLAVTQRIVCVAEPVLGVRGECAVGVGLDESL